MFGETTISHVKILNHPIETTIYKWLFRVPGWDGSSLRTRPQYTLPFSETLKDRLVVGLHSRFFCDPSLAFMDSVMIRKTDWKIFGQISSGWLNLLLFPSEKNMRSRQVEYVKPPSHMCHKCRFWSCKYWECETEKLIKPTEFSRAMWQFSSTKYGGIHEI